MTFRSHNDDSDSGRGIEALIQRPTVSQKVMGAGQPSRPWCRFMPSNVATYISGAALHAGSIYFVSTHDSEPGIVEFRALRRVSLQGGPVEEMVADALDDHAGGSRTYGWMPETGSGRRSCPSSNRRFHPSPEKGHQHDHSKLK